MADRADSTRGDARAPLTPNLSPELSRRVIVAGIAAAPFAALPVVSGETTGDPVLKAMEIEQKAYAAFEAHWPIRDAARAGLGNFEEVEARESELCRIWSKAHADVLRATPATTAGAIALLKFMQQYIEDYDDPDTLSEACASLEAFLSGGAHA